MEPCPRNSPKRRGDSCRKGWNGKTSGTQPIHHDSINVSTPQQPGENQPPCPPIMASTPRSQARHHPHLISEERDRSGIPHQSRQQPLQWPKTSPHLCRQITDKEWLKWHWDVTIHANHHHLEARWNLGRHVGVYDAELFGILQATSYARGWAVDSNNTGTTIWIFVNNQVAIRRCTTPKPATGQHLATQVISSLHHILQTRGNIQTNIRWIPGHTGAKGNETSDKRKECSRAPQPVPLCLHIPCIHQTTDPTERP